MEITSQKYLEAIYKNIPVRYWGHRFLDIPVFLEWSKIPRGAQVLEVGCGQGNLSYYLSKKLKAKTYTAIDIDPKVVASADSKSKLGSDVIFQVGDACKLPFENESFDLVVILDLLHHLPNWKKAIRECHRVLKKNGQLWLRDYSIESFAIPGLGLVLQKVMEHPYDMMFDQIELLTNINKNGFVINHQNDSTWKIILTAAKKSPLKKQ